MTNNATPWASNYIGESSGAQCYGDIHRASLPRAEKRARDCELMPAGTCKGQHADRTMEAPTYRLTETWAKRPARKAEQERRAAKAAEHAAFVAKITGGALKAAEPAPGPAVGRQAEFHQIARVRRHCARPTQLRTPAQCMKALRARRAAAGLDRNGRPL